MKELAVFLGTKLDKVLAAIKAIEAPKPTDLHPLAQAINKLGEHIKHNAATVDVTVDTSTLEEEVRTATKAVKAFKAPSTSAVEALLARLVASSTENTKAITKLSTDLASGLSGVKLSVPETFKLDDMQLRSIRSGGSLATTGHQLSARSVTLANVAMSAANTEYSYTFPSTTVAWELRLRSTDVPLLIAYVTGKLPTSGDGSAYFSVPAYYVQTNSGVDWGGKTIYIQTGTASQTLEIIVYRAKD